MQTPKMTDGYSDTYKKLGVSQGQFVAFRIKVTLVGIPAFFLAFSSGSPGFFIIMGAYCLWVWKMDPAEQIPRQRKAQQEKAEYEEKIRMDERQQMARRIKQITGREVIDV